MQDERRSYHGERNFGNEGKEGAMDKESRAKEEIKAKLAGRKNEITTS